jgi:hypothetical protein
MLVEMEKADVDTLLVALGCMTRDMRARAGMPQEARERILRGCRAVEGKLRTAKAQAKK